LTTAFNRTEIAFAQFGAGGGFFDNVLNQALPRVSAPVNQNPQGNWPPTTNNLPSSGFNTGSGNSIPNNAPNIYTTDQSARLWPGSGQVNSGQANSGQSNTMLLPKDWRLGVTADPTQTGAVVRQVTPNSPAQRAGLETGDIILAVSGFQVGYVGNRLNDVGEQIRRSADNTGRVQALVFDARTARLDNISFQLDSASSGLSGSVALQDRGNLPFNSILTVQIENVTRPFYEVRNGKVITAAYGTGPFPFEIQYDPAYIDTRDRYQLNALITDSAGRTLYALRQPIPIPTGGLPPNTLIAVENIRDLKVVGQLPGGTVTSSYGQDPALLAQIFQQILGRPPSTKEQVAWSGYLAQGNSVMDLKSKIIGSPSYYDRLGNNPLQFIQTMIQTFKGQNASPTEVNAWLSQLQQYQGNREQVARAFLQQIQ